MTPRTFDLDGGPGDRHRIIVEGAAIYGAENLFDHLPNYARHHSTVCLVNVALQGERKYDIYTITELEQRGIAQTAEHRTHNPGVGGATPPPATT